MGLLFVGEYVSIKVIEKRTVLAQKTGENDHDNS
jgi:hypothetical protein